MTACEIRVISRDAVRDDPQVVLDLAAALSRKTRVLVMHLATTGMRAGDRVALLLDQLIGAYGVDRDGTVRLVIRHSLEELARMIGVTRVTVSRELSRLAALGIVEKDGWDIVVLDPDAIQRHVEQLLS